MTHNPTFPELTKWQNKCWKKVEKINCPAKIFLLEKKIKDDTRKWALLLHYVGEHTHDIYEANKSDQEPDDNNRYETAITKCRVLRKLYLWDFCTKGKATW